MLTQARFRAPFQESLIPTPLGHTLEEMRLQPLGRCKPPGTKARSGHSKRAQPGTHPEDHSAQISSFPGFTTRSTLAQDFPVNNIRVTVSYGPMSGGS